MTREALTENVRKLIHNNHNVALQWATGVGKSKATLDMLNEISIITQIKPLKVLLVIAEIAHNENWKAEINKWYLSIDNVTIICYASLKNYKNTEWDCVIYDEAHHLDTELRLDIFSTITSKYNIFLSATLSTNLICSLREIIGSIVVNKVTLKDSIDWNILPEPKIYLIPLELDTTLTNQEIIEEWGKREKRIRIQCDYKSRWSYIRNKLKYPNVELHIKCTEREYYSYLSENIEYLKKRYMCTRNIGIKNRWLQMASKRKRFLGDIKTPFIYHLLDKLKQKRYICFCSSITQVEALGDKNCVHSLKKNCETIINKFNNKQIHKIFAVGMLQEGVNLTDIDAGIIVQLDGNERSWIQKHGRVLRSDDPIQFIFYYKDTRDEEYLNKILETIDDKYITTLNNIKELSI